MSPKPPPKPIREESATLPTGDPRPLRRKEPGGPQDEPTTWKDPQAVPGQRRAPEPPPLPPASRRTPSPWAKTVMRPTPPSIRQKAAGSDPPPQEPRPMSPRASQPDQEIHPVVVHRLESLERDQGKLEDALPRLEGKITGVELSMAKLAEKVEQHAARTSSDTVKQIVAGVVAVVTAVVGSRVVAPAPPAAPPPERSAFDRALDACAKLEDDKASGTCIGRVIDESMPARR